MEEHLLKIRPKNGQTNATEIDKLREIGIKSN